jgi:tripartite-type tricarboxylate transporter receptor subunit TctC
MTTDTSYSTAKALTGTIRIGGNTFPARDWLKAQGARWDAGRKTWTIVLRGGNQATVNLLQGIVSRGMQWERA